MDAELDGLEFRYHQTREVVHCTDEQWNKLVLYNIPLLSTIAQSFYLLVSTRPLQSVSVRWSHFTYHYFCCSKALVMSQQIIFHHDPRLDMKCGGSD
jgi:hypothetical protein